MVELILYGSKKFNFQQNWSLLKSAVRLIQKSGRFNGSMMYNKRKHTPLPLFFQSQIYLLCNIKHHVYLGLTDHNQFF